MVLQSRAEFKISHLLYTFTEKKLQSDFDTLMKTIVALTKKCFDSLRKKSNFD